MLSSEESQPLVCIVLPPCDIVRFEDRWARFFVSVVMAEHKLGRDALMRNMKIQALARTLSHLLLLL